MTFRDTFNPRTPLFAYFDSKLFPDRNVVKFRPLAGCCGRFKYREIVIHPKLHSIQTSYTRDYCCCLFDVLFVSCGPQILIFGRFKGQGHYFNHNNYASIRKNTERFILTESDEMWLEHNLQVVVDFLLNRLCWLERNSHFKTWN